MEREFVCDCCFKDQVIELGYILNHWFLARINQDYVLMLEPGHSTDILINFGPNLTKDPLYGLSDEEVDSLSKDDPRHLDFFNWFKLTQEVSNTKINHQQLLYLYEEAKKEGYNLEDEHFIQWLVHYCADKYNL